jgi:peptidoglycan/LPS O-acetylase OafA/YrhL
MRKWLARLSFSFLIIAVFLGYQGYMGLQGRLDISPTLAGVYLVAAAMAMSLFFAGVRERHRRD